MRSLKALPLLLIPLMGFAEQIPKAYPQDLRVKHLPFEENNVVRFKAKTFTTTQVIFGEDEAILAAEGGDTSAWMATYHEHLPNLLFIKPTQLNSHTNLTVVTSKHSYYFELQSNKDLHQKGLALYALRFDYPKEKEPKAVARSKSATQRSNSSKKPSRPMNFNYRFSGSADLVPKKVYDDGRFTYFELADNQPVPAIFAVNHQDGKESLVNLRQEGTRLVVLQLAPQFSLRKGAQVASVFNTEAIQRIQQQRRQS